MISSSCTAHAPTTATDTDIRVMRIGASAGFVGDAGGATSARPSSPARSRCVAPARCSSPTPAELGYAALRLRGQMIRIVQLGSPRAADDGLRIGTVRRPPRGVVKAQIAKRDFYDVWCPDVAPSAPLVAKALAAKTPREWSAFVRAYRREMAAPAPCRTLDLRAAMSHHGNPAVGCYRRDEARCHRSELRALLVERGARVGV